MHQTIARQWVDALRSGEYSQGRRKLRSADDQFCCLGVLCNLHAQANPEFARQQTDSCSYGGLSGALCDDVQLWAGMRSRLGQSSRRQRSWLHF